MVIQVLLIGILSTTLAWSYHIWIGWKPLRSTCLASTKKMKSVEFINKNKFQPYGTDEFHKYPVKTLIIDNYDSYTYNLWQLLADVNGFDPYVVLNDQYKSWDELLQRVQYDFDNIIVSPGPGNPTFAGDFGLSMDAISKCTVPLLGVCLGHQGIGYSLGGNVARAERPMHGRLSTITHSGDKIFEGLPDEFSVVRYHSLIVQRTENSEYIETAWTKDGVLMGLKHPYKPIFGVQFHPESICTSYGRNIIENFKKITLNTMSTTIRSKITSDSISRLHTNYDLKNRIELSSPMEFTSYRHIDVQEIQLPKDFDVTKFYSSFFGNSSSSFWLDSSSNVTLDSQHTSYSFMGSLQHADDYSVEYLGNNRIIERYGWCDDSDCRRTRKEINQNIFEYISDMFRKEQNILTYSPDIGRIGMNLSEVLFGYIGYECRNAATHILSNHNHQESALFNFSATKSCNFEENPWISNLTHPLALFLIPTQFIVIDHQREKLFVISRSHQNIDSSMVREKISTEKEAISMGQRLKQQIDDFIAGYNQLETITPKTSQSTEDRSMLRGKDSHRRYEKLIDSCLESIRAGDTYEVCLTTQFQGHASINDSLSIYKELRRKNAAPYSSYLRYNPVPDGQNGDTKQGGLEWYKEGGFAVLCSSPERFLKSSSSGSIETKPIKGTARRNLQDIDTDKAIAKELELDEKSRAENLMIVDLLRNDFGRICKVGSVSVPDLMKIETYASVHQMVSTIRGRLKANASMADALVATFPGGSMTGAPKIRTMNIIDKLEMRPRGIYSGSIGYISLTGDADLNIVIRTAYIVNELLTIGSGGAVVILSDPQKVII